MKNIDIETLDFSVRTYNVLKSMYINNLDDLVNLGKKGIRDIERLGRRQIMEIEDKLLELHIELPRFAYNPEIEMDDRQLIKYMLTHMPENSVDVARRIYDVMPEGQEGLWRIELVICVLDDTKVIKRDKSVVGYALFARRWMRNVSLYMTVDKEFKRKPTNSIRKRTAVFRMSDDAMKKLLGLGET